MIDYHVTDSSVAVLTWNLPDRPVNVINDQTLALFGELIERALSDDGIKGLVIASAKRDFVTGADLVSFLQDRRPEVIAQKGGLTQSILRRLETGGKPVCAALNGSALGGGFEIALACHHRVAASKPDMRVGLPEVTLGLLPGAGGTQRLPRLIGLRKAIPLLLQGNVIPVDQALALGMVDEVVAEAEVLTTAIKWVEAQLQPVMQPWDVRGFQLPDGPIGPIEAYQVFAIETARISAESWNTRPAPRHILASVYEGHGVDIDTGLQCELRHFVSCVCSVESQNIIRTTFFGTTHAAKLKHRPSNVPTLLIKTLAVQGDDAVAQRWIGRAIEAGLSVLWLSDRDSELPETWATTLQRVSDVGALARADACLITEGMAPPSASIPTFTLWPEANGTASGRVALSLADDTTRLVEVIHDGSASSTHIAQAMDLAKSLRKVPIVIKTRGVSYLDRLNAANEKYIDQLRTQGVSDALIKHSARKAGMARSPLRTPLAKTASGRTTPDAWVQARELSDSIRQELLMVQAEAALLSLEEELVATPLDADIAAVLGFGFSDALGGPLGYIDSVGAHQFLIRRQAAPSLGTVHPRVRQRLEKMIETSTMFHHD